MTVQLAFLLYKYFPFGGMQRDFLQFAKACSARGHNIRVYALSWEGPRPDDLEFVEVRVSAASNHARNRRYASWVFEHLDAFPVDGVVGFNKMPGLDVYYAADSCFRYKSEEERGWLYRLSPRCRFFLNAEEAVFGASSDAHILLISRTEEAKFRRYYQTPSSRLHMLPPGIDPARRAAGGRSEYRERIQTELAVSADARLLLFVGSGFIKKGLDRAIRAVAALKEAGENIHLLIAGQDRSSRFRRLADKLNVSDNCHFLGGRDDIPELLAAADVLVHPALDEAAGIVLLEGVVAGLPIVVTDVCGYAHHIERAGCGRVLPSPFLQNQLNTGLLELLGEEEQTRCRAAALDYAANEDLYTMHETGAELIEQLIAARSAI